MRRNVTRPIEIIKETADDIDSTSESIKSNNMSLTVSESDILRDGMKILFKSSDYDEQVRLFTLSQPCWGRPQIQKNSSHAINGKLERLLNFEIRSALFQR